MRRTNTEKRLSSFQDFPNQGVLYLFYVYINAVYINVYEQLFCTILPLFSTFHTVTMTVIVSTHVHIKRGKKRRQVSKNTLFLFILRSIRKNLEMLDARTIFKILNAKKAHGRPSFSLQEKMRNKKKYKKATGDRDWEGRMLSCGKLKAVSNEK
jgi:hypothetical protein